MSFFKRKKTEKVSKEREKTDEPVEELGEEIIVAPEKTKEEGLGEILEFAKKKVKEIEEEPKEVKKIGIIEFEEVKKIPQKWEGWEKEDLERLQRNSARMSGCLEYQLIKHPDLEKVLQESKSAEERREKIIPIWNKLGLEKINPEDMEKRGTFSAQLFDIINSRALYLETWSREGKFVLNPKQEVDTYSVNAPLVSKTEDYLPELKENIQKKLKEISHSIKDEYKLKNVLEDCKEGANLHIGTFGRAALKEGDLVPAIDAFDYTNELENPEIVVEFKKQMTELTEEPEDRELLMKAMEKLLEISDREEKEKGEEELEKARQEIEKATEKEK